MSEGITRWRKKPVVIDAVQWNGVNIAEVIELTGPTNFDKLSDEDRLNCDDPDATAQVFDKLHSTWVLVFNGQWIIKGVKGEFYPCAADVFRETYEPAGIERPESLSPHTECRVCNGTLTLTVPDSDGEGASEQDCPEPVHDDVRDWDDDPNDGDDGLPRVPLGGVIDRGFDAAGGAW